MKKVMLVFGTRPEALEAGTVNLVDAGFDKIVNEVSVLLDNQNYYDAMSKARNPCEDSLACQRMVDILK